MNGKAEIIVCAECGDQFVWSAKDQQFYEERGFVRPRRCPKCRKARRERYAEWQPGARRQR